MTTRHVFLALTVFSLAYSLYSHTTTPMPSVRSPHPLSPAPQAIPLPIMAGRPLPLQAYSVQANPVQATPLPLPFLTLGDRVKRADTTGSRYTTSLGYTTVQGSRDTPSMGYTNRDSVTSNRGKGRNLR